MTGYGKSFGYKMAWLALRSDDTDATIDALSASEPREINWGEAIKVVYEDMTGSYVFITPPIEGWTLVAGPWTADLGVTETVISRLSARFGEAQAFATHRVVEYHHWMLARDAKLLRSFAYVGDSDELLTDKGDQTPIEQSLNLNLEIPEDCDPFSDEENPYNPPNEADVMAVAGAWSINPTTLDERPDLPETVILARLLS